MMKSTYRYLLGLLLTSCLVNSCEQQDVYTDGEGMLSLSVGINKQIITKSTPADEALEASALVRIYGSKGLVRKYEGLQALPEYLPLQSGPYSVKVHAGDSVEASFETLYFKGFQAFDIEKSEIAQIVVPCRVANTAVSVAFEGVEEAFSSYQVKVFVNKDTLNFNQQTLDKVGYFMLPTVDAPLHWIFEATQKNGEFFVEHGDIVAPKPTHQYDLTFHFKEDGTLVGGAVIEIEVDETEIEVENNVVFYTRPKIQGSGFDINEVQYLELNSSAPMAFAVSASSAMDSIALSSPVFNEIGLITEDLSFLDMNADALALCREKGIEFIHKYDEENDRSNCIITFTSTFMASISDAAELHTFAVYAKDAQGKIGMQDLRLSYSDAVVVTEPVVRSTVWAHRATLRGSLLKATSDALLFKYRAKGAAEWQEASATTAEDLITAELTDLTAATTYEYFVVAGEQPSAVVLEFTTEAARQLDNASFEFWSNPDGVWLLYGEGQQMFWDSGNHGAKMASAVLTEYDETVYQSGSRSIRMSSKKATVFGIGKFAAGNMFVGQYLKTDGMDGVLGFGRPFTSRPKKLRGYYRYNVGLVNETTIPDVLPKNTPDTAFVYIALGDWKPVMYDGVATPVLIKTKASERQLFNKNSKEVIAYGEMQQGTSTDGTGMHMFEIDIDYRNFDRIPTDIVVVASASKYGDYYSGSTSSVLWIDDLELIYE